jgi:Ca2+/H+ antiporter, TMEM165/GDT1 family
LEAFLVSTAVTFLAEMGDKTQFLALILASRFKKPWIIIYAVFCSTILNRILASLAGTYLNITLNFNILNAILAILFLIVGIFCFLPQKEEKQDLIFENFGLFTACFLTFFLAEMGDKTQIATLSLAAKFDSFILVTIGSTFGTIIADILAIFLGSKFLSKIPIKIIKNICGIIFIILAILTIFNYN